MAWSRQPRECWTQRVRARVSPRAHRWPLSRARPSDGAPLLDAVDAHGASALLVAISQNHANVATLLVSRGADVNISDDTSATPLLRARLNGDAELEAALVAAGAREGSGGTARGGDTSGEAADAV